jgi:hypothetical protein
VQRIKDIQRRKWKHHVYFLAENTRLDNAKDVPLKKGDLERIKKAFGVTWSFEVDAQLFSPGRRNRTFLTNFPVRTVKQDYIVDEEIESCLQDDFKHIGRWVEKELTVKANCFMAHKMRLDDSPRMDIFKLEFGDDEIAKKYMVRSFYVQERENIMGFPLGYVEGAGKQSMT